MASDRRQRWIVVGRGMIGSSAAKHLCSARGPAGQRYSVTLVGPDEPCPTDPAAFVASTVYGAHYDEGRITRKTDPDPTWAALAQASIDAYAGIEEAAGLATGGGSVAGPGVSGSCGGKGFYHEVGHLVVAPAGGPHIAAVRANAAAAAVPTKELADHAAISEVFPYLAVPPSMEGGSAPTAGLLEPQDAGWISPRRFVEAQTEIARQLGCSVVGEDVVAVNRTCSDEGELSGLLFTVTTSAGTILSADRVLLACGAFTNFRGLLPPDCTAGGRYELDLQLLTAQTAKAEVSPDTAQTLLAGMPSIIYKDPGNYWVYILPPIMYPDGRYYLKLGGGFHDLAKQEEASAVQIRHCSGSSGRKPAMPGTAEVVGEDEVLAWYRSKGDQHHHERLMRVLSSLFPAADVLSSHSDACVTCHTASGQLFVGELPLLQVGSRSNGGEESGVGSGLVVATGGNGYAAKSADAIGLLAAYAAVGDDAGPRAVELAAKVGLDSRGGGASRFAPVMRRVAD